MISLYHLCTILYTQFNCAHNTYLKGPKTYLSCCTRQCRNSGMKYSGLVREEKRVNSIHSRDNRTRYYYDYYYSSVILLFWVYNNIEQ